MNDEYIHQALLCYMDGKYKSAMEFLEAQQYLCIKSSDPHKLITSQIAQVFVMMEQGNLEQVIALLSEVSLRCCNLKKLMDELSTH